VKESFREKFHHLIHRDEFNHRPNLDELTEEPIVGGRNEPGRYTGDFMDEYEDGEETEIELFDQQKLDPDRVPADFMPWAHTRHRLDAWRDHVSYKNTTKEDGE
jgi:hypothetical protein